MKNLLLSVAALTLAAPLFTGSAMGQSAQTAPAKLIAPNLIAEGRHMTVLNAQNLSDRRYSVPAPSADATQFDFTLKGYVFGIRLITANYMGYEDGDRYAAYTDMRTTGLGALVKKMDIWSVTSGRILADGTPRPDFHVQQNTDKKNRRVEMNYDHDARSVDVAIVPPLGSQGVPPASPEQRYSAFDTISALLRMTHKGRQEASQLCSGRVPIFDSKQHYTLRLAPVGTDRVKFLGDRDEAIHCHAYYEPIAGYDPEDLPNAEEAGTPVDLYFRYYPEVDMHVPVRFSYKISGFRAVIKMDDLTLVTPEGTVISQES
ncbi:MAG: DUF3108 domain-containing protein [Litorimonas sp.]